MAYSLMTKNGHNMFDMASMLQKSIRRGDFRLAGYAANELSYQFRNYLWKRLLVISAEDCYGIITKEIIALKLSDDIVNKGKDDKDSVFISKAIVLLCMCKKNRDACFFGCNYMNSDEPIDLSLIENVRIEDCKMLGEKIPDWVFDVHTITGKIKGKTIEQMITDEQKALRPFQPGFFDDLSWEGFLQRYYDKKNDKLLTEPKQTRQGSLFDGVDYE